jgi:sugar transferase (PEP-CTERM system associated)
MLRVFQHHIAMSALAELLADALLCFIAVLLAANGLLVNRYGVVGGGALAWSVLGPAAAFSIFMSLLFSLVGMYRRGAINVSMGGMLGRAALALFMGSAIAYAVLAADGGSGYAFDLIGHAVLYMGLGLIAVRVMVFAARRASVGAPKVLIIGTSAEAKGVADDLRMPGRAQRNVVGFFAAGGDADSVSGARVFDANTSIDRIVQQFNVDEVIVAVREQRGGSVPMDQLLACRVRGIPVLDLAGFYERTRGEVPIDSLKASWLVYGNGFVQGMARTLVKRAFDIVSSAILLLIATPVMLVTALAIRLESRGPIIYRQERVGLGGRTFVCAKFRSMRTDAEKDGVARWAQKNDARVTRVGAFIRKMRIDELPQLINVLRGEMSLVGPRPERPSFVAQLRDEIPFYDIRHSVKPGVTGWAQVRFNYGASVEDARRKHQFDLYYVKNNSLFLDLLVLVETVSVVLFREGAH